jgi:hypothetical protein
MMPTGGDEVAARRGPGGVNRLAALITVLAFVALAAAGALLVWSLQQLYATPTIAEYLAHAGPNVKLLPAGELAFDGQSFTCGRYPTILNATLDDYGAAYFGFVLLNPARFATLPPILKRYAYAHECGHQYVGYDEGEADCFAVRRGKAEGWLDASGMDAVCDFISRSNGDAAHAFGVRRCAMMRRCFARARPGRERL